MGTLASSRVMKPAAGIRSAEAGSFLAQLDDLSARMFADLRGRTLAEYRKLHDRARRFTRRALATMSPADMSRGRLRVRWSGEKQLINNRWILGNVLTHQAAHHGQLLLIRHALRARKGVAK